MGSSQSVSAATFEEKLNISHSNTTGNLVTSHYEKLNNARQFYEASVHYPPHRSNSVRNAINHMSHSTNKNNINQKIKKFATVAVTRLGLKNARSDVKDVKYNIKGTEQQIVDNIKAETTTNKLNKNTDTKPAHTATTTPPPPPPPTDTTTTTTNNNNNKLGTVVDDNTIVNDNASPVKVLTQYEQICKEMNIITRVNKSSVGLLLKSFGRFCVKLSSNMSVKPTTSEIAKWVIGMDKALQDCRWTGKNFVCESHLVFIFMLMKNLSEDLIFYNVRELKEAIYVCLYISYTYNANEISYPARPFLSLGQDRNKFFQDCVMLGLKCSTEMLDLNASSDTYKKHLSLLLSYS